MKQEKECEELEVKEKDDVYEVLEKREQDEENVKADEEVDRVVGRQGRTRKPFSRAAGGGSRGPFLRGRFAGGRRRAWSDKPDLSPGRQGRGRRLAGSSHCGYPSRRRRHRALWRWRHVRRAGSWLERFSLISTMLHALRSSVPVRRGKVRDIILCAGFSNSTH